MQQQDLLEEVRALRAMVEKVAVPPRLMTTEQAAEFLGVGPDAMFAWRKEGKGPPYLHISSRVLRYDSDALLAWAREHEVKG